MCSCGARGRRVLGASRRSPACEGVDAWRRLPGCPTHLCEGGSLGRPVG
jgi:hypothetical protein